LQTCRHKPSGTDSKSAVEMLDDAILPHHLISAGISVLLEGKEKKRRGVKLVSLVKTEGLATLRRSVAGNDASAKRR
ncbi:MAG TPA: hypothetical protein VMG10_27510, partial [Gemmataceae bacterium]|nr:hypothetical protein [Gemmataceae bacterium]